MKAALYIRVSTTEQLHGYSLDAQEELLRKYAEKNCIEVYGLYADKGKSAYKPLHKRESLLRMVSDAEQGKFQCILFKDITRWSRNSSQYWTIQDRLDKCGVYWTAVEQPYLETKTPTGRFQVTIMLGTAQLESENTSQRIRFVQEHRAMNGGYLCGSVPFGYKLAEIDGMKRLIKDPDRKKATEEFFERYMRTWNKRQTVQFINEKYGFHYNHTFASKIINNTIYFGKYRDNTEFCEPYITESEWNAMQQKRQIQKPRTYNYKFFFRSLIRCPVCGRTLTSCLVNGKYLYYRCSDAVDGLCSFKDNVKQPSVEKSMLDQIGELLDRTEVYEVSHEKPKQDNKNRIKKLNAKLNRLKELYLDGDIDKQTYTARKRSVESEIALLNAEQSNSIPNVLNMNTDDWRALYKAKSDEEKGEWFRFVLDWIEVTPNGFVPHFRNHCL